MGMGRPSKRDAKLDAVAVRARALGMTFATTAHLYGVHPDTFREWRKTDDDFSAALDQAYADGIKSALVAVVSAWDRDWKAAAWWIEKIAPHIIRQQVALGDEGAGEATASFARQLHGLRDSMDSTVPGKEAA